MQECSPSPHTTVDKTRRISYALSDFRKTLHLILHDLVIVNGEIKNI